MVGNGANFCTALRGPKPGPLKLAIRPHDRAAYRLSGDREFEIGRYHHSARAAFRAIREFCRQAHYEAHVMTYTPDAVFWRDDRIGTDGKVRDRRYAGGDVRQEDHDEMEGA